MTEPFAQPVEGFLLRPQVLSVEAGWQEEKLASQGLSAEQFDAFVDPSFFIGLGIQAGIESGISAEGNVNMLSRIVQHRPVRLGETLTVKGRITSVQPVPRGRRIATDVWFESEDGAKVIEVPRVSLKPDPTGGSERGAGDRPPAVIESPERLSIAASHQLSPEGTRAYSSEGNAIHYELDAARRAGFRAPIIGGGQGVHFLMAAIWAKGLESLDLDIYFRRPVFWDDRIEVGILPDFSAVASIRAGKILTEARINHRKEIK